MRSPATRNLPDTKNESDPDSTEPACSVGQERRACRRQRHCNSGRFRSGRRGAGARGGRRPAGGKPAGTRLRPVARAGPGGGPDRRRACRHDRGRAARHRDPGRRAGCRRHAPAGRDGHGHAIDAGRTGHAGGRRRRAAGRARP
ncbi:hypothetical protein C2862_11055 [Massilia sp. Mn16-1_5]|nr:hypothetical protein C2862_11055 [Massilia sp. Mn16-1_5]